MKMRLRCEEPDKIVFTVTTTAPAKEWEQFRDCLDESVMKSLLPKDLVYGFRNQINDLLAQARRIYWASEPSEQPPAPVVPKVPEPMPEPVPIIAMRPQPGDLDYDDSERTSGVIA